MRQLNFARQQVYLFACCVFRFAHTDLPDYANIFGCLLLSTNCTHSQPDDTISHHFSMLQNCTPLFFSLRNGTPPFFYKSKTECYSTHTMRPVRSGYRFTVDRAQMSAPHFIGTPSFSKCMKFTPHTPILHIGL